jgi:hypothetical protein
MEFSFSFSGNLQDHHSHPSLSSRLVAPLKSIYSSLQVSDVLVLTDRCKCIDFCLSDIPSFYS